MKTALVFGFTLLSVFCYAGGITGNMAPLPNSIEEYTVTWDAPSYIGQHYCNVNWFVTNGTVVTSDKFSVTIQWDDVPTWLNGQGNIRVEEDLGGQSAESSIILTNWTEETSETCSGILGPPSVSENFGAGLNPGQPLPAGTTSYVYSPNCLQPNMYTRSNSVSGCNGRWRILTEDHTPGDVNGYMLVVDGSASRGEIYRTRVSGLTQAFKYEFSAYLINLVGAPFEEPRVRFEIYDPTTGLLIKRSNSFTINWDPNTIWQKVSFMIQLPATMSIADVVVVNENANELGNDFAIDDISFAPCYSPIIASFTARPNVTVKSYTCNTGNVNLFFWWPTPRIPFVNPIYKWQRSADNGVVWGDIAGASATQFNQFEGFPGIFQYRMYAYEASDPSQTAISNQITFFVQKMVVEAGKFDIYNCNTNTVQLVPRSYLQHSDPVGPNYTYTYNWTPSTFLSSATIPNPVITLPSLPPPSNTIAPQPVVRTYNLTVTNTSFSNCQASNVQTVTQFNPRKVAVPSAFTPNGDGVNDLFRPVNLQDYPSGKFWVFNRWGEVVFYSEGPGLAAYSWNGNFNGNPQPSGVYPWRVEITGCPSNIINASTGGGNQPGGTVTLIR